MDPTCTPPKTDRHRIVRIDPETGTVSPFAGSNYVEGVRDGVGVEAFFSYPDAIWGDGTHLYVTQNTVTIRRISLSTGEVTTIGEGQGGLPFDFRLCVPPRRPVWRRVAISTSPSHGWPLSAGWIFPPANSPSSPAPNNAA